MFSVSVTTRSVVFLKFVAKPASALSGLVCGLRVGLVSPGLLFVSVSVVVLALVSLTMACSSMSPLPCRNPAHRAGAARFHPLVTISGLFCSRESGFAPEEAASFSSTSAAWSARRNYY